MKYGGKVQGGVVVLDAPSALKEGTAVTVEPVGAEAKRKRTKVKVRGKYATAAAEGTVWEISYRCDGTLTRVVSGTVSVTDRVLDKTVKVEAGEAYLACATRRGCPAAP